MIALLRRIGGVLLAPRPLFKNMPDAAGPRDDVALFTAYALAVALPGLAAALADFMALGLLPGLSGLAQALLPLLPWVLTRSAVEWRLGDARAHRASLCMVPLLVLAALAHLADLRAVSLPGPAYLPALLGGLAALALASWARSAIPSRPERSPDLPQKPADHGAPGLSQETGKPPRGSAVLGLAITALVATNAALDARQIAGAWSTLAPVATGDPMPDFALPLLDGGTLRRADLVGAPHLLIFWTTWCGVCEAEMPMYAAVAARHPALKVVGINADREGEVSELVRRYRDTHDLRFPIALDRGGLGRDLRVRMFPHLLLLAADGQIAAVFRGRTFERSLESAIAALPPAGG